MNVPQRPLLLVLAGCLLLPAAAAGGNGLARGLMGPLSDPAAGAQSAMPNPARAPSAPKPGAKKAPKKRLVGKQTQGPGAAGKGPKGAGNQAGKRSDGALGELGTEAAPVEAAAGISLWNELRSDVAALHGIYHPWLLRKAGELDPCLSGTQLFVYADRLGAFESELAGLIDEPLTPRMEAERRCLLDWSKAERWRVWSKPWRSDPMWYVERGRALSYPLPDAKTDERSWKRYLSRMAKLEPLWSEAEAALLEADGQSLRSGASEAKRLAIDLQAELAGALGSSQMEPTSAEFLLSMTSAITERIAGFGTWLETAAPERTTRLSPIGEPSFFEGLRASSGTLRDLDQVELLLLEQCTKLAEFCVAPAGPENGSDPLGFDQVNALLREVGSVLVDYLPEQTVAPKFELIEPEDLGLQFALESEAFRCRRTSEGLKIWLTELPSSCPPEWKARRDAELSAPALLARILIEVLPGADFAARLSSAPEGPLAGPLGDPLGWRGIGLFAALWMPHCKIFQSVRVAKSDPVPAGDPAVVPEEPRAALPSTVRIWLGRALLLECVRLRATLLWHGRGTERSEVLLMFKTLAGLDVVQAELEMQAVERDPLHGTSALVALEWWELFEQLTTRRPPDQALKTIWSLLQQVPAARAPSVADLAKTLLEPSARAVR